MANKPLKYVVTPAVKGVKKASKEAPKIARYATPKEWQKPELPEFLIDLTQQKVSEGFLSDNFVLPDTKPFYNYRYAIAVVVTVCNVTAFCIKKYPFIKQKVKVWITQCRQLYKATKVSNWRQSVIKGRISTSVLPLADYSLRACASHPSMRSYIKKRCSKPEFRTFFNNFSYLYNRNMLLAR